MKILITSDWHLDAVTDGVTRWDEVAAAVDQSVQIAIEEKVSLYVMVGDLCNFDGWNSVRAMSKSIEVAIRLDNASVSSLWIAGNHDVVEDGLGTTTLSPLVSAAVALNVFENPGELIFTDPVTSKRVHIVGLPFTPVSHAYDPEVIVRKMSKPTPGVPVMVFGHLNLKGISAGSETKELARGREVYWPVDTIKRKWPGCTIFGGHYHTAQEFNGVNIVGSLARLRHDEEGHNPSLVIVEV